MAKKQTEAKNNTEKKVKISKKEADILKAKELLEKNGMRIAYDGEVVVDSVVQDFRSSLLILSIAINTVIFITWIILQYTNAYDQALVRAFLVR